MVQPMEAGGWYETGPVASDFDTALRAAQKKALRAGGYVEQSPDELWNDEEWVEFVGTGGTGSVLDLREVIGSEWQDDFTTLRPMSSGEFSMLLGIEHPTRSDFVTGYLSGRLPDPESRGSGRCAVIYSDNEPNEIGYWGLTAD